MYKSVCSTIVMISLCFLFYKMYGCPVCIDKAGKVKKPFFYEHEEAIDTKANV